VTAALEIKDRLPIRLSYIRYVLSDSVRSRLKKQAQKPGIERIRGKTSMPNFHPVPEVNQLHALGKRLNNQTTSIANKATCTNHYSVPSDEELRARMRLRRQPIATEEASVIRVK
jgi:hypothetical protein